MKVCDECVRAVAMIGLRDGFGLDTSWNVISRHPESGTDCALCGRGPGVHPAEGFVRLVVERRPGADATRRPDDANDRGQIALPRGHASE